MKVNIDDEQIILWAKEAIHIESEALRSAAHRLDKTFSEVVRSILVLRGKVILTGLGKSGHVARKIAATLSSTGTSSFFIHPTEALHGDFGMIGENDLVIAIAFGGETREVIEVLKYARRMAIKSVGICGKQTSSLAQLVDYYLDGMVDQEACPLNLAPTSSTAVSMAIGDALAISLMRSRGFKEIDFANFHPDGSLGRKLSVVSDHMRKKEDLAVIGLSSCFYSVLESVTKNNFGIVAVVSEAGKLEGVITDGDLRRAIITYKAKVFDLLAKEIMTKNPKTISLSALAVDAFTMMERYKITSIFVDDGNNNNKLEGIVRMYDLLAAKIV